MASGPRYSVPFRRRREGRTDYALRKALVVSGKPRAVVRRTNKYVYIQIIEAHPSGDTVSASASSKELAKLGWKGGTGNLPAAYLTGSLAGRRALQRGVNEAILDIGLRSSTKGSRAYAALKGLADSGLQVPHSPENLPSVERLGGSHIAKYAHSLSTEAAEAYKKQFSRRIASGVKPENLPEHFQQIRQQIQSLVLEASA